MAALTQKLARQIGVEDDELVNIYCGAILHDIGKIGIPDDILLKPGSLTDAELEVMKLHPQYAFDLLKPIEFLHQAMEIPYCHHEKWDGSGYPKGLIGDAIPYSARMFAVIDVFDALTSNRPYRKAWTKKKTYTYIREQKGKHFDPDIVDAFMRMQKA